MVFAMRMFTGRGIFVDIQTIHWFRGMKLNNIEFKNLLGLCSLLTYIAVTFASHEIVRIVREVGSSVKVGD